MVDYLTVLGILLDGTNRRIAFGPEQPDWGNAGSQAGIIPDLNKPVRTMF
jgi:hypothetical protein